MRINKYIASTGFCSRRKAEELIEQRRVKVNGKPIEDLSTQISSSDVVLVDDKQISHEELKYFLLNKPTKCLCSAKDDRNRPTVVDLIKTDVRIYPVGRLDYFSEGLLILTNDGNLTYKLTHPKNEIEKTYLVKIKNDITEEEIKKLESGATIFGVKYGPCKIKIKEKKQNYTILEFVLHEGKNREIRNMLKFLNKTILKLKRVKIAKLQLDSNLKSGEYRELTEAEKEYLLSLWNIGSNNFAIKNYLWRLFNAAR